MSDSGDDGSTPLDPRAVEPGTNVLVAGPALTGKRGLVFDLLGGSADRAAIVVTTKSGAGRIEAEFGRGRDLDRWRTRVIDCVSRQRGVPGRDTPTRSYVSSAGDLTGIGIKISGYMREFYHDPWTDDARIGLHSLSTMLMYADLRRVYQFLHVVTGRIERSGFVGVFSVDAAARRDESIDRLMGLFDVLVEVRDAEETPELRVRGGEFGPRRWTSF